MAPRNPANNTGIPEPFRHEIEARTGVDLSDVRVHYNSSRADPGARAFTTGTDIHFAPGAAAPNTPQGQELLAHELAHVVQHQGGPRRGRHHDGLAAGRIIAASGHPIDTD